MPVVPFSNARQAQAPPPPLNPVFLATAAAQMHAEGRLLANQNQEQIDQWDVEDRAIPKPRRNTPPVENWPSTGQRDRPAMNT